MICLLLIFGNNKIEANESSAIAKSLQYDSCKEKFKKTSQPSNVFDPRKLKVGDRFLGLKVSEMEIYCWEIELLISTSGQDARTTVFLEII